MDGRMCAAGGPPDRAWRNGMQEGIRGGGGGGGHASWGCAAGVVVVEAAKCGKRHAGIGRKPPTTWRDNPVRPVPTTSACCHRQWW